MSNPEHFKSGVVFCKGGLNSNQNWLYLSETASGAASRLINFEPGLYGGYRRIDGFEYLEDTDTGEVDPTGAEGKILGIHIFNGTIIAARKQQSGATYNFYEYSSGASWSAYTTGLTLTSTNIVKIYGHEYNFTGTENFIFTDGVNNATLFDGTSWSNVDPAGTGANFANAGGAQALAAPKYCHVWENHVFMASGYLVAHSAPNAGYDWTSANGAGQLNVGFEVVQIYPFRDKLFVFGEDQIRYIYVTDAGDFAIKDVTSDIGCRASDSVVEVGGDLIFLGPDGIRPISATERIGDFDIASISKDVQKDLTDLIEAYSSDEIHVVSVRSKSQFRLFFSDANTAEDKSVGVIGGQKLYPEGIFWEFGRLLGIKASCCVSGYISNEEYIIHGGHDGKVYRQEQGNSFNGANIQAVYRTPYLDFGIPSIRKSPHKITVFARPEGSLTLNLSLSYDWRDTDAINPSPYSVESSGVEGTVYGTAVYDTSTYGATTEPRFMSNVQGSGHSMQLQVSTNDTSSSYSIQSIIFEFETHGFK